VILHVTVCTADRRAILATDTVHDALRMAWNVAGAWVVGYYLVMPDHIHLFCAPAHHTPPAVKAWAKYWKRLASQAAPALHGHWLPDCWDTQMRSQEHYMRKLEYVAQNPVRKGLVEQSDEWPYQGKMGDLIWIS
jgi:putative transposase